MHEVLIAGAGRVGELIATLLADTQDYHVHVIDISFESLNSNIKKVAMDITDKRALIDYIKHNHIHTIISCLPYQHNYYLAQIAKENELHYFDLTEDTTVQANITALATGARTVFVPQCGLAPGFISIVTNDLMQQFEEVDSALMRVGALPTLPHNNLKYLLTWSTDGLINQYGNPCHAIEGGKEVFLQPLEGLETIEMDGLLYEAFNTSGGLGTLAKTYGNQVKTMNYKTLRYPGHCEKMHFLMHDLKLNHDRQTLKRILETAVPRTLQDVVIIYVSVSGFLNGLLVEKNYMKKIYPDTIGGKERSAIAISTAMSACAVIDLVLQNIGQFHGIILQEAIKLREFLSNRFGKLYA